MQEKQVSAIDAIFDENNTENVVLTNEKGEAVEFEQIAIIPIEDDDYAILKPVEPLEGMNEDEGLVFKLEQDENDEDMLVIVQDEEIIDQVFDIYDKLFDEEAKGE